MRRVECFITTIFIISACASFTNHWGCIKILLICLHLSKVLFDTRNRPFNFFSFFFSYVAVQQSSRLLFDPPNSIGTRIQSRFFLKEREREREMLLTEATTSVD